ncbi:hypothetical protein HJ590_15385 [Naumannella sp. ID2617S]|nr:hypothetical protein [Naumannella sp. ID2617S]
MFTSNARRTLAAVGLAAASAGTPIDGNDLWYALSEGNGWVSARHVDSVGQAPATCPNTDTEFGVGLTTAPLSVRNGPTSRDAPLTERPPNHQVMARCQVRGENVNGNDMWLHLQDGTWVSAAYLRKDESLQNQNWPPVPCDAADGSH